MGDVRAAQSALIDLAEAAYDLEVDEAAWLPQVMEAGLPVLNHGLGVFGGVYTRPLDGGALTLHQLHVAAGGEDFIARQARVAGDCPPEVQQACTRPGICTTLSEAAGQKYASAVESWTQHHQGSKDALGLSAVDPDGQGAMIAVPLAERTKLTGALRERWQMVGAHLATGYRLRRRLQHAQNIAVESQLPLDADALLDPKQFAIKEATREAEGADARQALREAAVLADRARGAMRKTRPEEALRIWTSLTGGRWSLVDWFDSDDRRFVLALRNPPDLKDPRGLTDRESQVATFAGLGDSGTLIAYRLGISKARVSVLLKRAMRKLGVSTHTELTEKIGAFVRTR
ncbi:MAG: LuxR C-terminal-related transcriptional regulator [Polyangiales bacterium]